MRHDSKEAQFCTSTSRGCRCFDVCSKRLVCMFSMPNSHRCYDRPQYFGFQQRLHSLGYPWPTASWRGRLVAVTITIPDSTHAARKYGKLCCSVLIHACNSAKLQERIGKYTDRRQFSTHIYSEKLYKYTKKSHRQRKCHNGKKNTTATAHFTDYWQALSHSANIKSR